jgi:uncharacterized membrane protein SpoIIM required for sporulation
MRVHEAMSPGSFEKKNAARWLETDMLMLASEKKNQLVDLRGLPRRFREMCADLSLAQHRMYGQRVIHDLNERVIRGYKILYRGRRAGLEAVVRFSAVTFPQSIRSEWRLFWVCSGFFWLPFLAMLVSVYWDVSWVQSVLGQDGMSSMEQMYGGSREEQVTHLRSEYGSNFMMFAHYIQNNVGIDFQVFAGGILASVGTIFFLVFNGVFIGAAAGYVQYACNPQSFWTFVVGHSSFELLGMIVVGMAGMRMGMGLLKPGRLPRVRALKESAARAMPLLYGGAVMTAFAAVIEGFWSAREMPDGVKYAVGGFFWLLHIVYFLLAGRGRKEVSA